MHGNRAKLLLAAIALCMIGLSGCAGWRVGAKSMYRCDLRTIHVPVFESDEFRRGLGERLTEAVVKEIESKTPYKVVSADNADSVLSGRITSMQKRVIAENVNDEPRSLEAVFNVQFQWVDRRSGTLIQRSMLPMSSLLLTANQPAHFVPEAGQSMATAQQQAIQRLAEQIVNQMEIGW